jgi:hypothetical protein
MPLEEEVSIFLYFGLLLYAKVGKEKKFTSQIGLWCYTADSAQSKSRDVKFF